MTSLRDKSSFSCSRCFFATHVAPVLEQQIFGSLEDGFILHGGFTVLAVSDLVDDAAKGGHDLQLIKDDLAGGQFFLTALMNGSHMSITTASMVFRCLAVS
jgi:hypothetical protein